MRNYTYNWEVKTLISQFIDAFNDVIIKRYDQNREPEDRIHCNFVYSPKTRTLHDIVNKAQHIKLPVISVWMTSIQRAEGRVFNKIEGPYYNMGANETGISHPLQPVPVDITVNMSIITRFQTDMDQILTNFMPYSDPYIVISWREPYTNFEIRTPIQWNNNISLTYPTDISHNQAYRCVADTSFVIQGWVYKFADEPSGKIYNIDTSFTAVSSIHHKYETLETFEGPYTSDYFTISGRPFVSDATPYSIIPCESGINIDITGSMYDKLSSIYVSGGPGVFELAPSSVPLSSYIDRYPTYYNPLSGNPTLSADYPGFTGIQISEWTLHSQSKLSFTMPNAVSAGFIDVLPVNEAGYGKLTVDSVRPTLNPYTSGSTEYNNYVEPQLPVISGIQVLPFYDNCS